MNIYEAVATYLQTKGVGTLGANLFIAFTPSSPDLLLTINPTGGISTAEEAKHNYDMMNFQLFARGKIFTQVYNLLENAYNKLQGLHGTELSGYWIVDLKAIQSKPILIGRDAQDRPQFTQNFTLEFYNSTEYRV